MSGVGDPKEIERLLNKALNKVIPWNGFDRQSFEVEGLLREAIRQIGEIRLEELHEGSGEATGEGCP